MKTIWATPTHRISSENPSILEETQNRIVKLTARIVVMFMITVLPFFVFNLLKNILHNILQNIFILQKNLKSSNKQEEQGMELVHHHKTASVLNNL